MTFVRRERNLRKTGKTIATTNRIYPHRSYILRSSTDEATDGSTVVTHFEFVLFLDHLGLLLFVLAPERTGLFGQSLGVSALSGVNYLQLILSYDILSGGLLARH